MSFYSYATATHRHFDVSEFQKNPKSSLAVPLVVVGRATVDASNEVPNVNATAPVPVTEILSVSPSAGVPVKLDVSEVIAVV